MNFKNIHIGSLVEKRVTENGIETSRICNFLKCSEDELYNMYRSQDLSTDVLLRFSKLLEYDFFRLYTQHLILYAPPGSINYHKKETEKTSQLPVFRKNIYTKEIIDFMMDLLRKGVKTKSEIIREYRIPKTTLYKWITKEITATTPENNEKP